MDYTVLRAEIVKEIYQSMSEQEAADYLNAPSVEVQRSMISAEELWENTALTEYKALTQGERDAYQALLTLGTIRVADGSNSRATLAALFPVGSATRAALVALLAAKTMISIAASLGLPFIGAHHVAAARGM